jgi:prepilin-type N-terminal cleavage/methylation domain-containing protein
MKRAFTLIELLVVIAIIAILAAILFPVFAQAKEAAKKTANLSNQKQLGTAFHLYLADSDDVLPQAIFYIPEWGGWNFRVADYVTPVPAGWLPNTMGFSREPYLSKSETMWANSTLPYMKSVGLFEAPGAPELRFPGVAAGFANPQKPWAKVNATMNGLLHSLPVSSVAQPSRLPLLWGMGKMNVAGFAYTNPVLWCPNNDQTCRWSPTGQHQSSQTSPIDFSYVEYPEGWSYWTYGRGMNFVSVDGSAKFRTLSRPLDTVTPRYSAVDQPFSSMGPKGEAGWLMHCSKPSGYYQPCMFRPDSEFDSTPELQQW